MARRRSRRARRPTALPDFQALQNAFDARTSAAISSYYLFDVPFLNGYDLRARAARAAPRDPAGAARTRRRSRRCASANDFAFSADELLQKRLRHGARRHHRQARATARYVSGRSTAWIKLKCRQRQEFVIGGYSEPAGSRAGIRRAAARRLRRRRQLCSTRGASAPASTSRRSLRIGSSSTRARQARCRSRARRSNAAARRCTGSKPELVAECNFAEWTKRAASCGKHRS